MAFIGTPLDTRNTFQSLQGKRFDGDGSTTAFTLDVAPSSTLDIEVFVGNVRQDPNSAYTLSGTTLTFTGAPPSGTNNIYVVHQAKSVGTINAPGNSITSDQLNTALLTGATDIGAGIADADLFLVDDGAGGTLRKTAASRIKTYVGGFDVSSITGATALTDTPAGTDEFVLSDNGTLKRIDFSLMQNTPHWEVGLSSDQGIPNSTMTKLQFAVDRKNASGSPDYWDNSNYRTQNLTAGDYFAYLNLTFEGNAGSSTAYILIKRYNSSNVEQQSSGKALDQWTKVGQYHGSIFSVASGDYIAYELWQNSGGTVTQLYEANDGSLCFGGGFKIA
jgi:hypothetical protein